ncbi:MAG: hypothetical protein L3J97_03905, partial [Thermoplasmata archaeon]|nr:hypothetical protein [Thermoplasmata archaeon]
TFAYIVDSVHQSTYKCGRPRTSPPRQAVARGAIPNRSGGAGRSRADGIDGTKLLGDRPSKRVPAWRGGRAADDGSCDSRSSGSNYGPWIGKWHPSVLTP